jgi:hypothetical protein
MLKCGAWAKAGPDTRTAMSMDARRIFIITPPHSG